MGYDGVQTLPYMLSDVNKVYSGYNAKPLERSCSLDLGRGCICFCGAQHLGARACGIAASANAKSLAKIELPKNFSNTTSTCRRSRTLSLHHAQFPKLILTQ